MKLPNKVYDVEIDYEMMGKDNVLIISYYPSIEAARAENLAHIKLPRWLSDLIKDEIKHAEVRGREDFRDQLKKLLS